MSDSLVSVKDEFVISGAPGPSDVTEGCGSLGMFLYKRLLGNGDGVAVIDGVYSSELRYLELLENAVRLADCLLRCTDLRSGDVVGIVSENRLEFPVVLYAAFFIGATVAPINLTYTEHAVLLDNGSAEDQLDAPIVLRGMIRHYQSSQDKRALANYGEFDHAINLSKPKIMFISPYSAERVVSVARKNRFIDRLILFGDENPFGSDVTLYEKFLTQTSPRNPHTFPIYPTNVDEHVALILCSSGTTGLPKGVQLTQRNVMASVALLCDLKSSFEVPLVVLSVIPWFHAFGCLTLINVLCNKLKLVSLPKFEEGKHPLVESYDLSCINTLICGAAPLSKETAELVKKRIGVKYVLQGYGMSETTLATLLQPTDSNKPGSVGRLQIGTKAKVIDTETGKPLGPNRPGELLFKGTQIMKGYIGNEKATNETIDKDGWLRTGDIGYYDEDNEFYIIDRLKELIKYKGYQVPPAEIEAILLANTNIKDAGVVGVPDEAAGELPLAFVVKQPGASLTEKEVRQYVAERTSPAKRLHGGVRFVEEIPKNVSGKILRRELRAMLQQQRPIAKL